MEKQKNVIVILGAGRTGSSLLTKILIEMGMAVSENLIAPTEANPAGFFEDEDIVNLHKDLYSFLGVPITIPLPEDFLLRNGVSDYKEKLQDIVSKRIGNSELLWGFKDPRTASLLPLWSTIFRDLKLNPIYILTVRNPSTCVVSNKRHWNVKEELAEMVWLVRVCDAVYYTTANCFVVHYEDWFTEEAGSLYRKLAKYAELEINKKGDNSNFLETGIVKNALDRSRYEKYETKNIYLNCLYSEIKNCKGSEFDRDSLMKVVMACRDVFKTFSIWHRLNDSNNIRGDNLRLIKKINDFHKQRIKKLDRQEDEIFRLESRHAKFEGEIKQINNRNKKLQIANLKIKTSPSFKIGNTIVRAFKKPGLNTILLPYNLFKIVIEETLVRKKVN